MWRSSLTHNSLQQQTIKTEMGRLDLDCFSGFLEPNTQLRRNRKGSSDVSLCCYLTQSNPPLFCDLSTGPVLGVSIVLLAWNPPLLGQVALTSCQGPRVCVCACVRECVSALLWLESWIWRRFWLCSVTHLQHQTRDETVRVRARLQCWSDRLNYNPEPALYLLRRRQAQVEVHWCWPGGVTRMCRPGMLLKKIRVQISV